MKIRDFLLGLACLVSLLSFGQDRLYVDSVTFVPNPREHSTLFHSIAIYSPQLGINSFVGNQKINFGPRQYYIGFVQEYQEKWMKGWSMSIPFDWMLRNSVEINGNKYRLNGFRIGIAEGYLFRIKKSMAIEPFISLQYRTTRLTDKTNDSKLRNHNIGAQYLLRMHLISKNAVQDFNIALSAGYSHNYLNSRWKKSDEYLSEMNADKNNMGSLVFGLSIGILDTRLPKK